MDSRSTTAGRRRQRGFALVEVLVAFVILSAVVIAGLQVFSNGLRTTVRADRKSEMVQLAAKLFADMRVRRDLRAGVSEGRSDGYAWRLELIQAEPEDRPDWLQTRAYVASLAVETGEYSTTFHTVVLTPFGRYSGWEAQ